MLKRKLFLILFFIIAVSLINAVVLIEASYQHNELTVDKSNHLIFTANSGRTVTGNIDHRQCADSINKCAVIDRNAYCLEYSDNTCETRFYKYRNSDD